MPTKPGVERHVLGIHAAKFQRNDMTTIDSQKFCKIKCEELRSRYVPPNSRGGKVTSSSKNYPHDSRIMLCRFSVYQKPMRSSWLVIFNTISDGQDSTSGFRTPITLSLRQLLRYTIHAFMDVVVVLSLVTRVVVSADAVRLTMVFCGTSGGMDSQEYE